MEGFNKYYNQLLKIVRKVSGSTYEINVGVSDSVVEVLNIPPKLMLLEIDILTAPMNILYTALDSDSERIHKIGYSNNPPESNDIIFSFIERYGILGYQIRDKLHGKNKDDENLRIDIHEFGQICKVIEESYRRLGYI